MNIRISVIYAIHRADINLRRSLESIQKQSFKDFEVLMVDAASDDDTACIMKAFCSDERFKYIRLEDKSISAARNYAMDISQGRYIAFGDNDLVFADNFLEELYSCVRKEKAELGIAPMVSFDIYGEHKFSSSGILSKRSRIDKFDTQLIWNPAITNKLFLKSKIDEMNHRFFSFGKAKEAAFSVSYALNCDTIVSSSTGAAGYMVPYKKSDIDDVDIGYYRDSYKYIIKEAQRVFGKAIEDSVTEFEKKEYKKLLVNYIDQIYHKEITVLLYSYYRHFWSLDDEKIKEYTDVVTLLANKLSASGFAALREKNKDIFYSKKLIDNKSEMARKPKVTVGIGKNDKAPHHEKNLEAQVKSIYEQTMPCFELLVDSRLKDIFPEKYMGMENLHFVKADSLGEFKDAVVEQSATEYIMFQDGFALLNPKILMRHYVALEGKEKYGFSTSPITCFDGEKITEYSFSELSFSNMDSTRAKENDESFCLDLFFCNKLFRKEHLKGIHFSFSDNKIFDMYNLYKHSRFKKLSHRGAYLSYTEQQAMDYLRSEEKLMPVQCKKIFRNYRMVYFSMITMRKIKGYPIRILKRIKAKCVNLIGRAITKYYSSQKIKDRVFFYTIRANDELRENIRFVYENCDCEKVVFAKMLPHSFRQIAEVRKYLLTSKVIVTDDYLKYLRDVRLRDEQKVIQIWHAGGAFKRFGLDAPSRLTPAEEYKTHSQYSDVCVTSEYVRQFYAHAFGIDIDVVKAVGSPRTDEILDKASAQAKKDAIVGRHPLLKDKKVYVYFPTFREDNGTLTQLDPKIDWAKLNDDLSDDEVFVVARHPVMKYDFFGGEFYSRVKDYTSDPTPELLSVADVVITDYSSIIFDASLMDKAMLFYCPDYGEYERDFYLDYDNDLPGEIVTSSDVLLDSLRKAQENCSKEKIAAFREKQMGACDGKSTQRVVDMIKNYLEK